MIANIQNIPDITDIIIETDNTRQTNIIFISYILNEIEILLDI